MIEDWELEEIVKSDTGSETIFDKIKIKKIIKWILEKWYGFEEYENNSTIVRHYGTCDICKKRHKLILHFGYFEQPEKDFRICKDCLKKDKKLMSINKWN